MKTGNLPGFWKFDKRCAIGGARYELRLQHILARAYSRVNGKPAWEVWQIRARGGMKPLADGTAPTLAWAPCLPSALPSKNSRTAPLSTSSGCEPKGRQNFTTNTVSCSG